MVLELAKIFSCLCLPICIVLYLNGGTLCLGVDIIKPFAPCAGAKCAVTNVLCFIKKNSTLCALSRAPSAIHLMPCAMRHGLCATRPTFMKEFLSIALCACYFCAMCSALKNASLFVPRPKFLRHTPNFYEIDPWWNHW